MSGLFCLGGSSCCHGYIALVGRRKARGDCQNPFVDEAHFMCFAMHHQSPVEKSKVIEY